MVHFYIPTPMRRFYRTKFDSKDLSWQSDVWHLPTRRSNWWIIDVLPWIQFQTLTRLLHFTVGNQVNINLLFCLYSRFQHCVGYFNTHKKNINIDTTFMCQVQMNVPRNDLDNETSRVWQSADVLSIQDTRQYSLKILFYGLDTILHTNFFI